MSNLTQPFTYIKAIIAAVGATVFPPIADWAVSYIPAPANVHIALSILLVALLTGGSTYAVANSNPAILPAPPK